MPLETDLLRNQNQRNSFLRGFPLPFNGETLQAFGALLQIAHYNRKFCVVKQNYYVLHALTIEWSLVYKIVRVYKYKCREFI
jgi:hypothetical protein